MTTAQRQAAFQARNPGYDRRRKARGRLTPEQQRLQRLALLQKAQAEADRAAESSEAPPADADGQFLLFPAMRLAA